MVYCPECETDLDIDEDEVDEGAVVSCPECGTDFEVVTVNPVELKVVGEDEIEEDEDEEDADEEEDERAHVCASTTPSSAARPNSRANAKHSPVSCRTGR